MNKAATSRSPLAFFSLVFLLSVPFFALGYVSKREVLPGLPMSSFAWICPATAAAILVYRRHRTAGLIELLRRSFDYRRIDDKLWYVPIFFLMPAINVAAYVIMRATGEAVPFLQLPGVQTVALFVALFIAALGEELGWSGYVTEPMQQRWGALGAGILIGIVWAVWHWIPLLQVDRTADWISWWSLFTVASRVLIVWIYDNTGKSVFAAALFHADTNLCWQLFPVHGSYWDPRITGLLLALIAAIVVAIWGPRALVRRRSQLPVQ